MGRQARKPSLTSLQKGAFTFFSFPLLTSSFKSLSWFMLESHKPLLLLVVWTLAKWNQGWTLTDHWCLNKHSRWAHCHNKESWIFYTTLLEGNLAMFFGAWIHERYTRDLILWWNLTDRFYLIIVRRSALLDIHWTMSLKELAHLTLLRIR